MKNNRITEIGIDDKDRLYIKPESVKFPLMYRTVMEVYWDADLQRLYAPKPRRWLYTDWYKQMLKAAQVQGSQLTLDALTEWKNIDADLKEAIEKVGTIV